MGLVCGRARIRQRKPVDTGPDFRMDAGREDCLFCPLPFRRGADPAGIVPGLGRITSGAGAGPGLGARAGLPSRTGAGRDRRRASFLSVSGPERFPVRQEEGRPGCWASSAGAGPGVGAGAGRPGPGVFASETGRPGRAGSGRPDRAQGRISAWIAGRVTLRSVSQSGWSGSGLGLSGFFGRRASRDGEGSGLVAGAVLPL